MAVTRYKGKWRASYRTSDGRQRTKVVADKKEGMRWIYEEQNKQNQVTVPSEALMYSEACSEYIASCVTRHGVNTVREKKRHLRDFAKWFRHDFEMESLDRQQCNKFLSAIQKEMGNKSANRRKRTLKALWNWHKEKLGQRNPWREADTLPEEKTMKYVPPKEDVAKVMEFAEVWERDLLLFFLFTGTRRGEALSLKWEDVNWSRKTIQVFTRKRANGNREGRLLPISAGLEDMLRRRKADRVNKLYVFTNPITDDRYKINQGSITKLLPRLCEKAGVMPFGFHALRHYFSCRLAETNQASVPEIGKLLGHQRATTTDIYLSSFAPNMGRLARLIDSTFSDSMF
ncbi:MAG: tyrosine-type recombinase/integrase [Mailhella sp.]|nr:tyrosine-type recombinase/integrase [Mailhella sp.]